jgi:hypothetical protein
MAAQRRGLTEPLESLTWMFGAWMAFALGAAAIATWLGSGSIGGFGRAAVCATLPNIGTDVGGVPVGMGISARRGATVDTAGTIHACVTHPTIAQQIWYTLIDLPSFIFWACLLFLLWRMLSTARSRGPFAPQVATALRRLGWFIIVGAAVAGAVHGVALDAVINSLFRHGGPGYGDALIATLRALLPVPVIAGATMLTFARIIRAGQAMDEEIKATI